MIGFVLPPPSLPSSGDRLWLLYPRSVQKQRVGSSNSLAMASIAGQPGVREEPRCRPRRCCSVGEERGKSFRKGEEQLASLDMDSTDDQKEGRIEELPEIAMRRHGNVGEYMLMEERGSLNPRFDAKVNSRFGANLDPIIDANCRSDANLKPRIDTNLNRRIHGYPRSDTNPKPRIDANLNPGIDTNPRFDVNLDPSIDAILDPRMDANLDPGIDANLNLRFDGEVLSVDMGSDPGASWNPEHLSIVTSLLCGTPHRKSAVEVRRRDKPRPLPLPTPHKQRPFSLPNPRPRNKALAMASPTHSPSNHTLLLTQLASLPASIDPSQILSARAYLLQRGSLCSVIRQLNSPERALQVFLWQRNYAHLWPDEKTLCTVLDILIKAGHKDTAKEMQGSFAPNSLAALEALALGFIRVGSLVDALEVKATVEEGGHTLNQAVLAKIIFLAARQQNKDLVLSLVEELGRFPQLDLKLEDCTALMAACSQCGLHPAVESLFHWWKSEGFCPNVVMYTAVMRSRSLAGKPREGLVVFWEMEESGCALDLEAFMVAIGLCKDSGNIAKALQLFTWMKTKGFPISKVIYHDLIQLCCKEGRLRKAKELLDEMNSLGFTIKDDLKTKLSFGMCSD